MPVFIPPTVVRYHQKDRRFELATFEGQILRSKLVVLLLKKAFGPLVDGQVNAKELVRTA